MRMHLCHASEHIIGCEVQAALHFTVQEGRFWVWTLNLLPSRPPGAILLHVTASIPMPGVLWDLTLLRFTLYACACAPILCSCPQSKASAPCTSQHCGSLVCSAPLQIRCCSSCLMQVRCCSSCLMRSAGAQCSQQHSPAELW